MKRMVFPATVLVRVGLLFACGGSVSPSQVANGIPMSLTIGDTPPPGVASALFRGPLCSRSAGKRGVRTEASACLASVLRDRADLMVGQDVEVRPGLGSSSGGAVTVTADLVCLWLSQITGQVANISARKGTFSLTSLSPLFTGATPPVNPITVMTLSKMDFEDCPNQGQLAVGQHRVDEGFAVQYFLHPDISYANDRRSSVGLIFNRFADPTKRRAFPTGMLAAAI